MAGVLLQPQPADRIGLIVMNLFTRLTRLFGRRRFEDELDEEMRFHLEQSIERNLERGMSEIEARREAMREFGGIDQAKEESRDAWGVRLITDLIRDLRYAAKSLARVPGFTVIAVLTLSLGIGVNAIMYSFVRDVVLEPLARDRQLNLVDIYNSRADANQDFRHFSHREYENLLAHEGLFRDIAAQTFSEQAVGRGDDLQSRFIALVSGNYFDLVGVAPIQGRFFTPEEGAADAMQPVAVANHTFWQRMGGRDDFVGSTIRVNKQDYTVIGITPEGFVGLNSSIGPDVWLPLGMNEGVFGTSIRTQEWNSLSLVGQLPRGMPLELAQSRMEQVNAHMNALALPEDNGPRNLILTPPSRSGLGNTQPGDESFLSLFAVLSMCLAATVLIVACLNLTNMILARGTTRRKEIAIRLSLGASRGRIIRQLATEGMLLSLLGGAVGLYLSYWAGEALLAFAQEFFAASKFVLSVKPYFDPSIIGVTLAFCALATLAASLGPALRITQPDLVEDIKRQGTGAPTSNGWRRFFSLGNSLVMLQIALSLTMLFAAALFVRSANSITTMDQGYDTEGQVVAHLNYYLTELDDAGLAERQNALLNHMVDLKGEGRVALSSSVPYNFELNWRPHFRVDGRQDATETDPYGPRVWAGHTAVSETYFDTLNIRLLRGRSFTHAECTDADGPQVAIIDTQLAGLLFGDEDPLGQFLFLGEDAAASGDLTRAIEVVGIVNSPREEIFRPQAPERIYRPLGQARPHNLYLHVSTLDESREVAALRRELREFDDTTPALFIRPLASFIELNINTLVIKMAGITFGVFGGVALVLAVVGVYGVKSHAVSSRTREIGIRMALGARTAEVMGLILRQGALQAFVGIGFGAALAFGANQVLSAMLYGSGSSNTPTLIGSAVILLAAVLTACWVPARRATRVDPAITLREE